MSDKPEIQTPGKVEQLIARISPSWAAKRAKGRREFAYEAAIASRLRGYAVRTSNPNDYTEARDRLELVRQARDLAENFGLFSAILRKLAIYSFGRVRYRAQTGDRELNKSIEAYIAKRSRRADVSGRFNLAEMARLALFETLTGGDCVALYRSNQYGTVPQLIDAERLGGGKTGFVKPNEFAGVEFDEDTGTPLQYWIYNRTPAGSYVDPLPYAADSLTHIFDPERYDRQRGTTPFAPVINEMRDLKEVMEACLIGVKFENYHSGFINGGLGQPNDPTQFFSQSSERTASGTYATETKIQPGIIQYLPEGQTASLIKSERPSGQFQSYLELLIRTIANAMALPYGFVYSLSGLSGPGQRMDAAQAHRVIEYWQEVIGLRFLRPTVERWIADGIASGEIEYVDGAEMFAGQFSYPSRITIDVGRESQAEREEIRAGLRSRADWWDEEGKDAPRQMEIIREEAEQVIESAKQLAEKTGFPIERCIDMLDNRVPNGTPSFSRDTSEQTIEEVRQGTKDGYDTEETRSQTQMAVRRMLSAPKTGRIEALETKRIEAEAKNSRAGDPFQWLQKYTRGDN